MHVLVDTNVLLRLFDRNNPFFAVCRSAVQKLTDRNDQLAVAPQSIAELWNVSTRPATARGGFGLSIDETERRVRAIERAFIVLPESDAIYPAWRELVGKHQVQGINVYDARLVACMQVHRITHCLTMNVQDFRRYSQVTTLHPADVV
jgi:predicted nucleic acid-binding protein